MHNGVRASALTGVHWRKSGRSGAGNCVEARELSRGGAVAVRNSRFPTAPRSSTPARRSRRSSSASRTATSTTFSSRTTGPRPCCKCASSRGGSVTLPPARRAFPNSGGMTVTRRLHGVTASPDHPGAKLSLERRTPPFAHRSPASAFVTLAMHRFHGRS